MQARMSMVSCVLLVLAAVCVPAPAGAAPTYAPATQSGSICSSVTEIPLSECEALVDFYAKAGGESWLHRTGWLETTTPCTWYNVGCTPAGATPRHVITLDGRENGLTGSISPLLGNLSELQSLFLSTNRLSGLHPRRAGPAG